MPIVNQQSTISNRQSAIRRPDISIIIPVFNEASIINDLLLHLRGIPVGCAMEVIVVDGDPDRGTTRAVTGQGEEAIFVGAPIGRALQMNAGAARAEGRILLFLHADTRLPPDALSLISLSMADTRYVAGAFDLAIDSPRIAFRVIERVASLRSRVTRIPFGDQAIFVRRDYFNALGGYPEVPLMEDVMFMSAIKKRGDRIRIIPRRAHTSARRWERDGILHRTLRNWLVQGLYLCGTSPERLAKLY